MFVAFPEIHPKVVKDFIASRCICKSDENFPLQKTLPLGPPNDVENIFLHICFCFFGEIKKAAKCKLLRFKKLAW